MDKYYQYGKIFREEFQWGVPFVQIYDPADIETVLRNQGRFPSRPINEAAVMFRKSRPDIYNTVGLVNAIGEDWHLLRGSLTSVIIQPRVVQNYLGAQSEICADFVDLLRQLRKQDGRLMNMMEPLHRLALESAAMFCLETRLGCLDFQLDETSDAHRMISSSLELFQSYQELFYGLPLWKYVSTAAYRKMERAELTIHSIVSKYISEAREKSAEEYEFCGDSEDVPSVVHALLATNEDRCKDVYTGIVDFITAGIDTSGNSIAFVLYHLARNAHVQRRLYEEICSVVGDKMKIEACDLASMPYLKACVKEAFRLTPTIPNIVRIMTEDLVLSGYSIPKGTIVCCHTMVAASLPEYVDRPCEFLPDRWLNGYAGSHRNINSHPFGFGPRMCPGRRFAEQEIYLAVIKLLQNFRIECDAKMELQYWFIVTPKPPVVFRLIDR